MIKVGDTYKIDPECVRSLGRTNSRGTIQEHWMFQTTEFQQIVSYKPEVLTIVMQVTEHDRYLVTDNYHATYLMTYKDLEKICLQFDLKKELDGILDEQD